VPLGNVDALFAWAQAEDPPLSLNLLDPSRRSLVEDALSYACDQARQGERSGSSDETCASGGQLAAVADKLAGFLARP
jgi:hypothetical protein